MTIEDFRDFAAGSRIETDICIVGSGPAGWTIAHELQSSGLRILIAESGGLAPEPDSSILNDIESVGAPLFNGRDRVLGGTSYSWTGRCIALDDIDYETRSWVPFSGWPFGSATIAPYLNRASEYLGAGPYGPNGRALSPDGLERRPDVDPTLLRHVCWEDPKPARFGPRFLEDADGDVRVLVHATVTHINTDPSGASVESVEISSSPEQRGTIVARAVVLCAGGMENARLLLYSNRVVPGGVGNGHDAVGRYLMDHPRDLDLIVRFDTRHAERLRNLFGPYRLDSARGRSDFAHGFALSPVLQREHGLLNCAAWPFQYVASDDPVEAARRLIAGPRSTALRDAGLVISQPRTVFGALRARLLADQRVRSKVERIGFLIASEQRPDPESRITLSERRDRFGLPIIKVDWRIGADETASQAVLAKTIAREFERLGLPPAQLADWVNDGRHDEARLVDGCHPSGATRMASDPRYGVVDSECQVHGVEGLYAAGSSVFPTGGHANPTLMIVALAVRLAARLKEKFVTRTGAELVTGFMPTIDPGTTVAVTGATGFIGGRLVEQLIEQGATVTCFVRDPASATRLRGLGATVQTVQLADRAQVQAALAGIELVFHCAYDWHDTAWNFDALRAIAQACMANECRRLVYLSSFVVYELPAHGELTENDAPTRSDAGYAHTKRQLETELFGMMRESALLATILQPTIVYGPFSQPWTIGPADQLRHGTVVLPDSGKGICNAVYVDDVVRAMIVAARHPGAVGQRFLISGPESVTWGRFYEELARAAGAKGPHYWTAGAIERETGKARALLRIAADPERVVRRVAQSRLGGKMMRASIGALPRGARANANDRLFGPDSRRPGHVHLPSREHLHFLQLAVTVGSGKARREIGYAPQFDLASGMVQTADFLSRRNTENSQTGKHTNA